MRDFDSGFDELIGNVYDAGMGRFAWQQAAQRVASHVGAGSISMFIKAPAGGVEVVVGMAGPKAVAAYAQEFAPHDLWHHESVKRGISGRAARGSEAVPDAVFERSYYYNEFSKVYANGIFYCCGLRDGLESGEQAIVALHRTRPEGDFDDAALARLDRLKHHLYRALDVGRRLKLANAKPTQALIEAVLPWGLVELSMDMRVRRMSDLAREMLTADDGLSYRGGRLVTMDSAAQRRLQIAARGAACTTAGNDTGSAGGYVSVRRPSGAPPYILLVVPTGRDRVALRPTDPAALVFITDPRRLPGIPAETLRDLFDLTLAEARIVAGVASGETLDRLAGLSGTSRNTVRTLLARAMPKLDVNSQAGIVRLLAPLPKDGR